MAGEPTEQAPDSAESQDTRHVTGDLVLQEGLPLKEVERRIGVAVASAGLRHRVVAFYLRDVHERGLHQLAGHRSVVNYAVSRFGISRREARELFKAGMALAELPDIDEAFREGRLCWSKVRELVKVAVAQHDAAWLQHAQSVRIDELALEIRRAAVTTARACRRSGCGSRRPCRRTCTPSGSARAPRSRSSPAARPSRGSAWRSQPT